MGSFASERRTFYYNLHRYGFTFSKDEIKQMIISVIIIAFIWSFNDWGGENFDFVNGIQNFVFGAVFTFISMVFNQVGQRIVAVHYGYDPIYEYGMFGLLIGLVIAFASRGYIVFFLPGAIDLRHLAASRLGEFRYYTNDWEWAKAGFMGPFLNLILAILLSTFKDIPIMRQLMIMNIMFAWFSLLPLPGNVGLYLFYPHFYFWMFTFGIVASGTLLLFFLGPLLTIIFSVVVGIIAIFWTYVTKHGRLG